MNTVVYPDIDGLILVIDIGGTHIKFGSVLRGTPSDYLRVFPADALRLDDPVAALADMVRQVIADIGASPNAIVSTVPGFLDTDEDRVLFAGNILALNGRRLATELGAATGIKTILERDSVLVLMGECQAGAGQGSDETLGIFFGTGVGAAYLQDGKPFRGAGWALEIGHIPFRGEGRQFDGMRRDCLETYVSGRALRLIADRHGVAIDAVFTAAVATPGLTAELDEFLRDQAFAVGTAIALFSPRTVILGGGVCSMAEFPRERLQTHIDENSTARETGRPLDLRWADLGWRGALHGARNAVAEHLKRTQ